MKKPTGIKWLFLVALLSTFIINEQLYSEKKKIKPQPLTLSYIANEGVMITSVDKKIIIDAIFNFPYPDYRSPDRETIINMLLAQPPFDQIDLVMVTHNHPDHFDATLVSQFMETHPESWMIAPTDTVLAMKEKSLVWKKIKDRVISLELKVHEIHDLTVDEIRIRAVRTRHDDEKIPANLIYLIETNGWTILHEGDSTTSADIFRRLVNGKAPVDLALVHYWFPFSSAGKNIIKNILKARHTALFHLTRNFEKDVPGWLKEFGKDYIDLFFLMPDMKAKTFQK